MESTDLRIGNLVNINGKVHNDGYDQIKQVCLFEESQKEIAPIPLTEEWLLKFGFIRDNTIMDMSYSNYKIKALDRSLNIQFIHGKIVANIYFQVELKHLHQLQNIYFALTGEELTIS